MEKPSARPRPGPNRSMPPGRIIPELAYDDVLEAARWLCRVFGFQERLRIGIHRVQLVYREGSIVVTARGEGATPTNSSRNHAVMVCVDDVEQHFIHARAQGARILSEPETHPFGERQYSAQDAGGHIWTFTQSVADVDPAAWGGQLMYAEE